MQWLKLRTDILDDDKINVIRSRPEGDALFVLWIGLLCIAMKKETDRLYIAHDIPYAAGTIAHQLRMNVQTVQLGLATFESLAMIDICSDGAIRIANLTKHQTLDADQRKRELTAARVRKWRSEHAEVEDKTSVTRYGVTGNATEKEIEKEKDINTMSGKPDRTHEKEQYGEEIKTVIDFLNEKAGTGYRPSTQAHRRHIIARLREGMTVDQFKLAITWCAKEWNSKPEMSIYLRPETVFGTKMSGYVENGRRMQKPKKEDINGAEVTARTCPKCGTVNTSTSSICPKCRYEWE